MQHFTAFHLGLHCSSKYPFVNLQYTKDLSHCVSLIEIILDFFVVILVIVCLCLKLITAISYCQCRLTPPALSRLPVKFMEHIAKNDMFIFWQLTYCYVSKKSPSFNILRDFRNAPFYIHCLFYMIDLRMFSVSYFILLQNEP